MAPSLYYGRLAPSPTGLLHLGHASTFRTAQLRAQSAGGTLLLRNEDLDPQRSRQEFVEAMTEDLTWLGIFWEPPMISQSGRTELYRASFDRLLQQGDVYPCKCSRKDLALMMQAPHEDIDDEPVYDGRCRPAGRSTSPGIIHGMNYRFRVCDGEAINFTDGNLGPQCFTAGKDFGDFLIWRRDGLPSYQLACVVDDAGTNITEVVRGRDLLKSTARQILLQRALGLPTPAYYHANLLTDEHGIRLAKRHDAFAIRTLRGQGLTSAEVLQMAAAASMTTVTSNS
jgi:glutamyl/glutaminyl-tRNA synthetase